MMPEYAKHDRYAPMRDDVANAFLDVQLSDLKDELIAERGGHPYEAVQASAHEQEQKLSPLEDTYRIGLALQKARLGASAKAV